METWNRLTADRGGRGTMVERRGRDWSKNMYEWPMDMDNGAGTECRSRGWTGRRRAKGKSSDKCNGIKKNK